MFHSRFPDGVANWACWGTAPPSREIIWQKTDKTVWASLRTSACRFTSILSFRIIRRWEFVCQQKPPSTDINSRFSKFYWKALAAAQSEQLDRQITSNQFQCFLSRSPLCKWPPFIPGDKWQSISSKHTCGKWRPVPVKMLSYINSPFTHHISLKIDSFNSYQQLWTEG